jgi:capsular exopolysaccharide synthesis family protein
MVASELPDGRASSLTVALRQLRERWWVIVLCTVVGLGLAFGVSKRAAREYDATSTLLFGSTSSNVTSALNAAASSNASDPEREQGTTLLLVTSSSVASMVKAKLRVAESAADLASQITVSAEPGANLIDITARDPDPRRAATLANAFAAQYKNFRRDTDLAGFAQGIDRLQARYEQTPKTAVTQRANLRNALNELIILQASSSGGVQVVGQATVPTQPATPRTKRNVMIGGLLGILFGITLVFALDLFDRRLKRVEDFKDAYRLPVLGSTPLRTRDPRSDREHIAALEPFRILRGALPLLRRNGRVKVIAVTSAVPGEGKTSTAVGLASALARSGALVALVEVDLRRPTMHRLFHLGARHIGLSTALIDRTPAVSLMRTPLSELPSLHVLPGGGVHHDSAELLGDAQFTVVLDDLAKAYDWVILDAPPLLPVADAQGLLDLDALDAVIVVGRAYYTTREQAARTRAVLDAHQQTHLGLVVNGLRDSANDYDYVDEIALDARNSPSTDGSELTTTPPPAAGDSRAARGTSTS